MTRSFQGRRRARLKVAKQSCSGNLYWVVSLGKKYTGDRRQRRYFTSRKEASDYLTQAERAREQFGREAFLLPLGLRAEALSCARRLAPFNATLTQAVEYYLFNLPKMQPVKSVAELCEEFLKSRRAMNCRLRTMTQYESYLRVICVEFGNVGVRNILRQDIEDWLEESNWSARTRKNYLITLTTLLNFAIGKGYRQDNPASAIGRPILDERAIGILTTAQVNALLAVTKQSAPDMIPSLTIGLFAGLRRAEFFALDWSEIDFGQRILEVKGIKAKTRQRRLVHIQENLLAWLEPYKQKRGPVPPEQSIDTLSERLRTLARSAGISPWPHNAMRHSFGSYFLAQTKDENLTASEMGNSPGVVIRHYRALVRDREAADYWSTTPTTVDGRLKVLSSA